MPERVTDGAPGPEAPSSQAVAALGRWARRRRAVWTLKLTTLDELVAQSRDDIELYYSAGQDHSDGLTPAEVAEGLANARHARAVQFDRAVVAAKGWISSRGRLSEGEKEDLEQETLASLYGFFDSGGIAQSPEALGVTFARRRWNDALRPRYRGLQTVLATTIEPEGDDEPRTALAMAADPASDVDIELVLDRLDRPGDQDRRRAGAQEAIARLSPPDSANVGAGRPSRCPKHRHRRRHRNTDSAYIDMDLAAVRIVSFFVDPQGEDCPAGWHQMRWAALGSVNPGHYGTWVPGPQPEAANAQAANRSGASLCLLWRLELVSDCLQEVADLVVVVGPVELRQALVTWVATPAQRRPDRVAWATVHDARDWCEKLAERLLAGAEPDGRWAALRRSEALAYRQSADVLRELVASDGVPAELANDVEALSASLANLAKRLSEPRESSR